MNVQTTRPCKGPVFLVGLLAKFGITSFFSCDPGAKRRNNIFFTNSQKQLPFSIFKHFLKVFVLSLFLSLSPFFPIFPFYLSLSLSLSFSVSLSFFFPYPSLSLSFPLFLSHPSLKTWRAKGNANNILNPTHYKHYEYYKYHKYYK